MLPCPASRSVARRFAGLVQRILNLRIINLEGAESIDSRGGNPMARSEKDRALLFLVHASGTEYVRADAFILHVPFRGGCSGLSCKGFWGTKPTGLPWHFYRQGVAALFIARIFVTFFGRFSVAQPETDVIMNGGLVQDTVTGEEYIKEPLSYEDYLDIECLSRKLGVHMHAITKDGIYTANRNIGKYTVYEAGLVNMPVYYRTPEEMIDKEIVKIMYIDEPEILDQAITKLPKELYDKYTLVKSAPFYLEIVKKTVNKGAAVVHLAEKLGLTKEETMAIGDEENDRSMLEVVGNPVVMENGTDELKKIAKYITKSNDESGVAYAIREWVLN